MNLDMENNNGLPFGKGPVHLWTSLFSCCLTGGEMGDWPTENGCKTPYNKSTMVGPLFMGIDAKTKVDMWLRMKCCNVQLVWWPDTCKPMDNSAGVIDGSSWTMPFKWMISAYPYFRKPRGRSIKEHRVVSQDRTARSQDDQPSNFKIAGSQDNPKTRATLWYNEQLLEFYY